MNNPVILVVEDREDDVLITRKAFRDAFIDNPIRVVKDGEQAIAYLSGMGKYRNRSEYPIPALVLLDIKMPRINGFEVLAWIRDEEQFKTLPVLVLTSSNEIQDLRKAYALGATSFLVKPLDFKEARRIPEFLPMPSILDVPVPPHREAQDTSSNLKVETTGSKTFVSLLKTKHLTGV